MYHSITFGDKNTWDDWHLVPSSRPVFNPPKQKLTTMDIPGADGIEDLSELLTGYPLYNNREGSFEFIVMNDYKPWQEAYSDIMDYLHGRKMKAVLEDDPAFYYEGRFSVNQWKSDKNWSKIVIDYSVSPYKLLKYSSLDDWEWDDIDFEHDFDIVGMSNIVLTDEESAYGLLWSTTFKSLRRTVTPLFTISTPDGSGMDVQITDELRPDQPTIHLPDGDNLSDPGLIIYGSRTTTIGVAGKGTFSINFRMGRL